MSVLAIALSLRKSVQNPNKLSGQVTRQQGELKVPFLFMFKHMLTFSRTVFLVYGAYSIWMLLYFWYIPSIHIMIYDIDLFSKTRNTWKKRLVEEKKALLFHTHVSDKSDIPNMQFWSRVIIFMWKFILF